ncbi:caspase-8 [Polymixia lowei]
MDLQTLAQIDEELGSSEVAALRFLCSDVLNKKRLETVKNGRELFTRLEEKGLLENRCFLSQLLSTIRRLDLLSLLETDSKQTDASPILSDYRVMLYRIHEDMTRENLEKMKFLLGSKIGRGQVERCTTTLDVMAEMERAALLSSEKLDELEKILVDCDSYLALKIQSYRTSTSLSQHQPSIQPISNQDFQTRSTSHLSMDHQRLINSPQPSQLQSLSISETLPSCQPMLPRGGQNLSSDSDPYTESPSLRDQTEYYTLTHNPRGTCLIINNEHFLVNWLPSRPGTQEDEKALRKVFSRLGFEVKACPDMTGNDIMLELKKLGKQNFLMADALVVCVLSHGEMGHVYGTDGQRVSLREITRPFISREAPTLAGKPKLFFIQACQGDNYQQGAMPCPPSPREGDGNGHSGIEEDAVKTVLVPDDADFLVGMATVEECKSFRNTTTGSIYIQEVCRQLEKAASSHENILTVLTRVNREVSKGEYLKRKQMPEPKYTLTKTLILDHV